LLGSAEGHSEGRGFSEMSPMPCPKGVELIEGVSVCVWGGSKPAARLASLVAWYAPPMHCMGGLPGSDLGAQ